jgi:hypothetical protein
LGPVSDSFLTWSIGTRYDRKTLVFQGIAGLFRVFGCREVTL